MKIVHHDKSWVLVKVHLMLQWFKLREHVSIHISWSTVRPSVLGSMLSQAEDANSSVGEMQQILCARKLANDQYIQQHTNEI